MASSLDDRHPATAEGFALCRSAADKGTPNYFRENVEELRMTPTLSVGIGTNSSLKASFWESGVEECQHSGDRHYASVVLHRGGGRVWRNNEAVPAEPGSVGMEPFESSRWRFEGHVSFMHVYLPFALLSDVCESVFERKFTHEQLWIPMGTRDERLCGAMRTVQSGVLAIEPTHLILDSWALILSEILVRNFANNAEKCARSSFGTIPSRGLAHVVDFIEANIDQDLPLASLGRVAAMSVYHFARRFKETVGVSPHAYVVMRRIRRAQRMLEHGKGRLADVAAACGFSNQSHFTTTFQRSIGVTPGEYRRVFHRRSAGITDLSGLPLPGFGTAVDGHDVALVGNSL
jgi:AraC family transcriptional regulator